MERFAWVGDIIWILPVLALIWKGALMSAQIKQNTRDIEECRGILQKQNDAIIASLNKLSDTMESIKTDVAVLKAVREVESQMKPKSSKKAVTV